jgi:DHA2 family multidrug resistance protein
VLTTFIRKREALHSVITGSAVDRVRAGSLDHPLAALGGAVRREAYVLAFCDAYQFCFWVAALGLLLAVFLKRTAPHPLAKLSRLAIKR